MHKINSFIRKDLKDFKPYHSQSKEFKYKLDANESPYNLPNNVLINFINYLMNQENLNVYPDTDSIALRTEIAKFYSVEIENIVCGVGSDQIIDYITKVFLEVGEKIAILKPTFSMYEQSAKLNHGDVHVINLDDEFKTDINKVIHEVNENNIKILFLCTPNNPTGNSFTIEGMNRIIKQTNCIIVIDEAYAEFSDDTMIPFIEKHDNIIILRTFSKAYGLAGARVGYAIGSERIINAINIVKAPYNLSTLSEVLAVEVLKNSDEYKKRITYIIEAKNKLFIELSEINWLKVYESDANFLLVDSKKKISEYLEENGILVRVISQNENPLIKERIRISIGMEYENEKIVTLLKDFKRR